MLFFEPAAPPAAPCTLPCQRRPWCRRDRRDEGRMRLENKVAVVVGGGQSPGQGVGNGRAAAMLYAREGAKVLVVDRALASADETVAATRNDGGLAEPFQARSEEARVGKEDVITCRTRWAP